MGSTPKPRTGRHGSAKTSSTARRYDIYSRSYDTLYREEQSAKLEAAMAAGWKPDGRHVDYGCGSALLSSRLARSCQTVVGVDISEGMLRVAKKRKAVELVLADAAYAPFRRRAFGSFSCFTAFHNFREKSRALEAMADSVKAQGSGVLSLLAKGRGSQDEDIVGRSRGLGVTRRIVSASDVILLVKVTE